jgi:hypothetical protein
MITLVLIATCHPATGTAAAHAGWRVVVREFPDAGARRFPRSLYLGNDAAYLVTVLCMDVATRRLVAAPASASVRAYFAAAEDATGPIAPELELGISALSDNEYLVECAEEAMGALAALVRTRIWRVVEQPGDWRVVDPLVVRDDPPSEH